MHTFDGTGAGCVPRRLGAVQARGSAFTEGSRQVEHAVAVALDQASCEGAADDHAIGERAGLARLIGQFDADAEERQVGEGAEGRDQLLRAAA